MKKTTLERAGLTRLAIAVPWTVLLPQTFKQLAPSWTDAVY